MSEALIKSIQSMLTEEKWTRAAISNYTKTHFVELAAVVEDAQNQNCMDEIQNLCDEHLSHTKNSIIALYISGMIALKKKTLDNSSLISLIGIFQDNHKAAIVIYLCESILAEDDSNKFALRTLADAYAEDHNENIWKIYETIIRLDHEEADIAKLLAEHYEKEGNTEEAVDYYKKALLRYVNRKTENQIKEIWSKLVAFIPEDIDFFLLVQRKIAKTISDVRSATLMQELYAYYKEQDDKTIAIDILKLMLSIDEKDNWARKELVLCFSEKYKDHSQLEDYIRISNLNQNWRNVFEAISDFEKHIAFDAKNFVYHRTWGVGVIRKVKNDEISINFGKKHGIREMSLKMAVNALQPLQKDHIWVLKATKPREELIKMIKADKTWALKIIIKSFDNNCDFKRIKAELVPSLLTATEWTNWSNAARKQTESDPTFGVNADDITMFTVRDRAISQEEKLSNEFKAQKHFFMRVDILMRFLQESDTESEFFADMFDYFVGHLRSFSVVNEQIMASFLVVRRIITEYPHRDQGIRYTFEELYNNIENPTALYSALKDTKNTFLRGDFLRCVKTLLPNWAEQYVLFFPTVLQKSMLVDLIHAGHTDMVKQLAITSFENYRDYREATLFFLKEAQNEEWFQETGLTFEKQLITLVRIMDICYREIANQKDTTENKKINRQVQQILFKENTLLNYMLEHDEDTITRLYTLVSDVRDLDPAIKMTIRNRILEKYPDFKFYGAVEEKIIAPRGLIVTIKKLDEKRQQLDHIINVEIPENSKEIGEALAQGDLRENAEYKAAKEKQAQLDNTAGRLQEEIEKAQVFDPATITVAQVGFGNIVHLLNKMNNTTEEFTILGPWESDPDNKIISYMSPLGQKLLHARDGEELNFEMNGQNYSYEVQSIGIAKF